VAENNVHRNVKSMLLFTKRSCMISFTK